MNKPYIQHHGVKGMKWGVRKEEVQEPVKVKSINRLRMEKQLRTLTDEELHRGRILVTGVLTDIGKQTAINVFNEVLKELREYAKTQSNKEDLNDE